MSTHNRRRGRVVAPADLPLSDDDPDHAAQGHRHGRLQQILLEELSALVRDELSDPRLDGVTVTAVELSVDYRNARVHVWVDRPIAPSREERASLARRLDKASPFLRASLTEAVDLKQVPLLRFVWSEDAAHAASLIEALTEREEPA